MEADGLAGCVFGRLTVRQSFRRRGGLWWECRCECGRRVEVRNEQLRAGRVLSCGCLNRDRGTHFRRAVTQLSKLPTAKLRAEVARSVERLAALQEVLRGRK